MAPKLALASPDAERYDPWSDERGKVPVDVAALTAVMQAVIKAGPVSERRRLWECWMSELPKAQEISEDRYPWEPVSQVSRVSGYDALRALHVTLAIISDLGIRSRLIAVAAEECDRLSGKDSAATPDTRAPGKYGTIVCARPNCGQVFSPRHPTARYHSNACRVAAYEARLKAKAAAKSLQGQPGQRKAAQIGQGRYRLHGYGIWRPGVRRWLQWPAERSDLAMAQVTAPEYTQPLREPDQACLT
jgi:hypothetical protein